MSTDRDTKRASWELPDALWHQMEPLIPPKKGKTGHPQTVDLRRITEGIFYVLRTGIHWQACPREPFGPLVLFTTTLPSGSKPGSLPCCGPKP
jgi:hypothetical protein